VADGAPAAPLGRDTWRMRIRIVGTDLPGRSCGPSPDRPDGHHNIHVGVQRRGRRDELLGLTPGDAPSAAWTIDCVLTAMPNGADLKGPYIQGPAGGRFVYLSWGTVEDDERFVMFRRAKIWLEGIDPAILQAAADLGLLVGRLGLADHKGNPRCASVRPPLIEWSAEAP